MILFSYFNQIKCFLFHPYFESFSKGEMLRILRKWLEFSQGNDSIFIFQPNKVLSFPPGFQSFSRGETLRILKISLEFPQENYSVFVFQSNKVLSFSPVFSIIFKGGGAAHFEEWARIFAGK